MFPDLSEDLIMGLPHSDKGLGWQNSLDRVGTPPVQASMRTSRKIG
jgi:hypothetical protein